MPRRKLVKKKKLSAEKEELLIDQVKQQTALYNIQDENYYNTKHKSVLWDSITDLLQEEKDILQDSWDSIKAKYKRESKKVETAAQKKEIYNPNWIHYNNLLFLKQANLPKVTFSNLDFLFESLSEEKVTDSVNPNMYKADSNDAQKCLVPAKLGRSTDNVRTDNGAYGNEENEDMTFFVSLLKHVKKVPEAAKLSMRNELNKVVKKFAYENQPIPRQKSPEKCINCCNIAHCYVEPEVLRERQIDNRLPYAISQQNRYNAYPMTDYTVIKKERKRKKTEIDYEYDTDDSDCVFVAEAKVVKKMVKHKAPTKTQKKGNSNSTGTEETSGKTFPMLGINPSQTQQLYEHLILQQQHLDILKYLNPGLNSVIATHSAASPSQPPTCIFGNSAAVMSDTGETTAAEDKTKDKSTRDN